MNCLLQRVLFAAIVGTSFVSLTFSQTQNLRPTFDGRWALNEKESFGDADKFYDEYTLTISERGAEITIETRVSRKGKVTTFKHVYFSDKRGEENLIDIEKLKDVPVKSKTARKGNSIRIRYEYGIRKLQERQRNYFSGTFEYTLKNGGRRIVFVHAYRGDFPDARSTFSQPSASSGITKWIFDRI